MLVKLILREIDINSSYWVKSLLTRMNLVKQIKTLSKVAIQVGTHKEIEFIFLHGIVSEVEKYNITSALIVNIDKTPVKYLSVDNENLAT